MEMVLEPRVPEADASAVEVPDGFRAEVVVSGLTYPTSVEFDDAGNMYIAEAGYSYGDTGPVPRIFRVSIEGDIEVLLRGGPLHGPINDLLWHDDRLYISHRGRISTWHEGGQIQDLVTGLPSQGDHHNNQMTVGPDGRIYFGQGTYTNSGVVGVDNFKMGWLAEHPDFHDIPPRDITLVGQTWEATNPLNTRGERVETSAFHPFGNADPQGNIVPGQTKANGTILRMNPDGSELSVYAWGLRNPYGLLWSPDGTLYATENGFDVRGSRPIANDEEDIYIIREGAWYGWPDYAMGLPVTDSRFKPKNKSQPKFVMADHPPVEQPWLNFPKHSAIAKLEFARREPLGRGHLYVAFFGHMVPMTGEAPDEHGGHRVVRIDPETKAVETFFTKAHHGHGGDGHGHSGREQGGAHQEDTTMGDSEPDRREPGSESSGDGHGHGDGDRDSDSDTHGHGGGGEGVQSVVGSGFDDAESVTAGPRRLLDVRFGPAGEALYIVDFGSMVISDEPLPVPGTGVIWRVVPAGERDDHSDNRGEVTAARPPAGLKVTN